MPRTLRNLPRPTDALFGQPRGKRSKEILPGRTRIWQKKKGGGEENVPHITQADAVCRDWTEESDVTAP